MSVLSTGTGALIAFQRALATVSHNVANVNTEGYSRQQAVFATRTPTHYGYGYVGNGVTIADVRRMADELATTRLLDAGGELARLEQLSGLTARLDSLFSDQATNLTGMWSNFFDAVSALSANAAGTAEREDLLARGNALVARFRQLDGQLQALDHEVNNGLVAGAQEINRLAAEIANLNAAVGSDASRAAPDLLDRRDRLVAELVGYTGGTAVVQDGGMINVYAAGGVALVVGTQASTVTTTADPYQPERLQLALLGQGGTLIRLDQKTLGGRMGGFVEFRNTVLDPAMAELGRLAVALATAFNEGHAAGMDLYGDLGGDFFSLAAPRVLPRADNASGATLSAQVADVSQLTGQNLVIHFDGTAWQAHRADTGVAVPLSGTGTAADPLRVDGMALVVSTTPPPAAGDRFLLQPTAGAAGGLGLAINDPSRIAAALPVTAAADLDNIGGGRPADLRVVDASHPALLAPAVIEFLDSGQYTIDGAGPYPFTPGQTISANGWSLVLDGIPAAGDRFEVRPAQPRSGDNGNAARLANLDDARILSGGTITLNGALGGLTTSVGSAARQAQYAADAQQAIYDDALVARESVAGVNLDEEASNMLRLQQAYQAAAQIIATADTMFQSILSAVRR
ncbi:flagellar hook-associated protein FlgK [Pseudoxanthomonas taiwanensis]|uniref:Flagellar hook-associated protein 1 n=1 Tax=Pseudoxanthomonas taiwanensis TaxID=176598 RepID=A0A921NWN8_9GAMM|nr:flagellar hook-associated protein FlgK [Pseudoxanthomonas taiwanensis]KAF1689997.1 flagellar hook-associated protein FlgK [Pseudoxanthomonas taiwanensis]